MRVAVIPSLGTRNTCDLIARIALLGTTIAAALSACSDEPEATPTLHLATTPTPSVAETPAPEPIANGILDPTPVPTVTYTPTVAPAATPTLTPANTPTTTRVSTPAPTSITLAAPTSAPTHTPTAPPTPTSTSIPTSTSTPEATPTTSPTHAPTASPTPTSSPTPTARESAVAHFSKSISWFGNPHNVAYTGLLIELWKRDADLGASVAELPWLADNIDDEERKVLTVLTDMAFRDLDLAETVVALPWFKDGITRDENLELLKLAALARDDIDSARLTASFLGLPWLADTAWLAGQSIELQRKRIGFDTLRTISFIDKQSATQLLSFPWVATDDFFGDHTSAVTVILEMLQEFPTVATEVLGLPWVRDDMTLTELFALVSIREIARNDLDLAWHVLKSPFMEPPFLQRDEYALGFLDLWSISGPPRGIGASASDVDLDSGVQVGLYEGNSDLLAQLAGQSWFSDGLDDDDAALLHGISYAKGDFRQALIETNYVASTTVTLPLTGEMGLAVVRHTPFLPDDQTLKTLEEGVRIMEDFMGAPLPVGDVTLLFVEPEFWTLEARAQLVRFSQSGGPLEPAYVRAIVGAVNPETGPPTRTLYHELGHYYLGNGPRWLQEGLANFLEAYTVARTGGEGLEERLAYLEFSDRCAENIWDHVNPYRGGHCDYELGEKFLLGMYAALGPDAVSAALRELYAQELIFDSLDHDSIYYAFQSNVPLGKEESFRTAWLRYHGSPVIDRVHADSPDLPPLVALYNATKGGTG